MMNRGRGRRSTQDWRPRDQSSPSTQVWRPREGSSPSTHTPANTNPHVGADVSSDDGHPDGKDNKSRIHEQASGGSSMNEVSRQFNKSVSVESSSVKFENLKQVSVSPVEVLDSSEHLEGQPVSKFTNDHQLPTRSNALMENNLNLREPELHQLKNVIEATSPKGGTNCSNISQEKTITTSTGIPEKPFDICLKKTGTPKLKSSLFVQNREKRNETKRYKEGQVIKVLRPGMVLLKNFIPLEDQVDIVQTCRKLGQGSGGFYQPSYGDGATMHLKMMCLGKNWDPKTSKYGERRSEDGAEPPPIPSEFLQLVQKAIQDTHAHLLKEVKQKNVESILPSMTPDLCIVNFYTSNGRLGLHKDKDESQESLSRGLPIVSISIGDSAEFLYGDQMDIDKAEKVKLESGDVLMFGGKSRHVFHGVTSILPKTAPQPLLHESDLRPGRLNLTFRKY